MRSLASILVLLMPALSYTGMLMTENAFFLAFVTACFAIALALERPTLLHQGLAIAAIGFTCAVRFQGLVLVAVYLAALALKLAFDLRAPDGPARTASGGHASSRASGRPHSPA